MNHLHKRAYRSLLTVSKRPTFAQLYSNVVLLRRQHCFSTYLNVTRKEAIPIQPASPLLRNTLMLRCTGVDAKTGDLETYAQFYEKNVICNQFGLQVHFSLFYSFSISSTKSTCYSIEICASSIHLLSINYLLFSLETRRFLSLLSIFMP